MLILLLLKILVKSKLLPESNFTIVLPNHQLGETVALELKVICLIVCLKIMKIISKVARTGESQRSK